MSNLKKMVALSLVATSLISTSAFATFTDSDSITATEAVDTLVALDIIKGYTDGSFQPQRTVTRAEMAKMIFTIKNGGSDNAEMFKGFSTTFNDINGHWAEGYIKYCSTQDIIAGKSETVYDPDGTVTGVEALKMVLVTLGYRADKSELTGSNWDKNTLVLATSNDLYAGFDGILTDGSNRENAAVILHNALFTETVRYVNSYESYEGTNLLLAESDMNLQTISNVYVQDSTLADGLKFSTDANGEENVQILATDVDYTDYIGRKVEILADSKTSTVYGVRLNSVNKVIKTFASDVTVSGTTASFDGVSITVTEDEALEISNALANTEVYIVNNGVNTIVTLNEVVVGEVLYKNSSKIHVDATGYKTGALTFADDIIDEDIAVGDFVRVYENKFENNQEVEILELKSGTVSGKRDNEFRIGTEWFTVSSGELNPELNTEISFYQVGSVLYEVSAEKIASNDHAYVIEAVGATNAFDTNKARVVLTDGTELTVETKVDESANIGKIVSFTVTNDVYSFDTVNATHEASDVSGNLFENNRLAGHLVNDDAVVFVKYSSDVMSVLSGEDVKAWGDVLVTATTENAELYTTTVMGYKYVTLGFIDLGETSLPNETTSSYFGYVVSKPYQTKEDDTVLNILTVFDGTENVELKVQTLSSDLNVGDYVTYELLSDGVTVETMDLIEGLELETIKAVSVDVGAITFEGATTESSDDIQATLDANTKIIFVDSLNQTGIEGGVLKLATDNDGDGLAEANVRVLVENGVVTVIFADILNEMQ